MKYLILAVLLATTTVAQAQWVNYPKTIRLYNKATGETMGTVTMSGGTAYVRNKHGEHLYTVVRNQDGTTTSFDPHGNVINMPMPGEEDAK